MRFASDPIGTVELDGLVNQADPVAGIAAEQTQGVVVLRPGKAERRGPGSRSGSARGTRDTWFAGSAITRLISAARAGVTRSSASTESTQSPRGQREREIPLAGEVVEVADRDDFGLLPGDFQRRIATDRIDDDDALESPARRRQAVGEVVRLVFRHDQDRHAGLRHDEPPS